MPTETGIRLLSSLRATGSTSALRDTPLSFFIEDDERRAFETLREHVAQHRAFPTPSTFLRLTGLQTVVTNEPLSFYIDRARRAALYTQLMEPYASMREGMEGMDPDAVVQAAQQVLHLNAGLSSRANDYMTLQTAMDAVIADYRDATANMAMRGITTGWEQVDNVTDGWQRDDLISVIGRPGIGKTYILLWMAYHAWRAGYSVLFVSMELGAIQLARRLFGLHSKINPNLIRKGQISTPVRRHIENMLSGFGELSGVPFNIVQGGFRKSVETVANVAEATNPDIIFADASYLMRSTSKKTNMTSRRENVADTIESIKTLSIDHHKPIVQSLQFNRTAERPSGKSRSADDENDEERNSNRRVDPTAHMNLAKIGETDVAAQASSIVIGATTPPANQPQNSRYARFLKGREGEGGSFQFNYDFNPVDMSMIQFGNLETEEETPQQRRALRQALNNHMV